MEKIAKEHIELNKVQETSIKNQVVLLKEAEEAKLMDILDYAKFKYPE